MKKLLIILICLAVLSISCSHESYKYGHKTKDCPVYNDVSNRYHSFKNPSYVETPVYTKYKK